MFLGDVYVTDICTPRTVSDQEKIFMDKFERKTGATVYHIIKDFWGLTYFLYVPATKGELTVQINLWNIWGKDYMYAYCYNETEPSYSECEPILVKKIIHHGLLKK